MKALKDTLSRMDKTLLYKLCVFILLYIVLIFFGIIPVVRKNIDLKKTKVVNREARMRALNTAQSMSQLTQDSLKMEAFLKGISERVGSERETEDILGKISEMANEVDVKITQISPVDLAYDVDATFPSFSEIRSFELNLEGGYHAVGAFLEKLETSHQLVRIVSLHLTPTAKLADAHQASMTISLFSKKRGLLEAYSLA